MLQETGISRIDRNASLPLRSAVETDIIDVHDGTFSKVVHCDGPEGAYAVKYAPFSVDASNELATALIANEGDYLTAFNELDDRVSAPLKIPRYYEVYSRSAYAALALRTGAFIVTSWVPGEILTAQTIKNEFTDSELRTLGKAAAQFVVWNSQLPIPTAQGDFFDENRKRFSFTNLTPSQHFYDKERNALLTGLRITDLQDAGFPSLAKALNGLLGQYYGQEISMKRPEFLGHNDFRAGNSTFVQKDGLWQLHGVFDMGMALPSTPERELRHWARLGKTVIDAMLEEYNQDGRTLDEERLLFWAKLQSVMTVLETLLQNGKVPVQDRKQPVESAESLIELFPGLDWQELAPTLKPGEVPPHAALPQLLRPVPKGYFSMADAP